MTFMGVMECIFADEKPTDYDLGATKDWLPKSKEFDDWVGYAPSMFQLVIAVYLIYGGSEDELSGLEENDMSWVFDCPGMEIQEVE